VMTRHARLAAAATGSAALLLTVVGAGPATGHGAPVRPLSRTEACGTEGDDAGTPACRAALAATGRSELDDWDNLRVANVAGRDREVIPDGKLCSGGIDEYRGLDLARRDWPTTTLRPGTTYRFAYRTTIPHQGTFRYFVTRDGYDPETPLTWSDLETKPFLTVTDPPIRDGAYVMTGTLPDDKRGRHLIYTVWQNSDTPDTYYSCSDVVFRAARKSSGAASATPSPAGNGTATPSGGASRVATPEDLEAIAARNAAASRSEGAGGGSLPLVLGGLFGLLVAGGGAAAVVIRRRPR
jgi:predicted carbohydrate-binding protein with CBM5 and CBM33 domain